MIARDAASSTPSPASAHEQQREEEQQRQDHVDRACRRPRMSALAGRTSSETASPVTTPSSSNRATRLRAAVAAAMGSIQADGPRRTRHRPPRRLGTARRALERAAARRGAGPTNSSSATRPRHPTSRSCRPRRARRRSATALSMMPRTRPAAVHGRAREPAAPVHAVRGTEPARGALPAAVADARGGRRHVRRGRALRLVDRRRPPGARRDSAPTARAASSSPTRGSSRTTPRTRRRRSRARCGRTTPGSPRSAWPSGSSACGCRG